jgi:hypothetical protein
MDQRGFIGIGLKNSCKSTSPQEATDKALPQTRLSASDLPAERSPHTKNPCRKSRCKYFFCADGGRTACAGAQQQSRPRAHTPADPREQAKRRRRRRSSSRGPVTPSPPASKSWENLRPIHGAREACLPQTPEYLVRTQVDTGPAVLSAWRHHAMRQ